MKTEWDYTNLADAYLMRPDYAPEALARIFEIAGLKPGASVCDVGAGVAHLTLPIARLGCEVDAVEPNDAMRANGAKRTADLANARWHEGTGEATGMESGAYDLVSFGSSFNVCDRQAALKETARLLKPGGYFACMWNHRDLEDPVQKEIENIIKSFIPDYNYGARREDQTEEIRRSGLFEEPEQISGRIVWEQPIADVKRAWQSHSTLERQAGDKFPQIIEKIAAYLDSLNQETLLIPYDTRAWVARKRQDA